MKKIFGMLSLIAILTVAFTSKAIASEADNVSTEYVASLDAPDFIAAAVVDMEVAKVSTLTEVFNVADVSVSSIASGEGVDITEIVTGHEHTATVVGKYNKASFGHEKVFLPFEVGWSAISFNTTLTLSKYENSFYTNGYEAPDIVSRISANVGKLTKPITNS